MSGDPCFQAVSLLLHTEGSDAGTTFTDSSNNAFTVTANGNAKTSTAQYKYGSSSGLFDGAGDYLAIAQNDAFNVGTGDFTIEAWVRLTSQGNNYSSIIASGKTPFGAGAVYLMNVGTGAPIVANRRKFTFGTYEANPALVGTTVANTGQWYHVAVTRQGSSIRLFVDGAVESSGTNTQSINFSTSGLRVGGNGWDGNPGSWNGNIDEVRITKGIARYTAAFTLPTEAFPDVQGSTPNIWPTRITNPFSKTINRIHYQRL